jgi:ribosome biogenesis protein Tsr3
MLYEVVLDAGETPNKCTIAPLAHRGDFKLFRVKKGATLGPFVSQILLHPEGECLSTLVKAGRLRPASSAVGPVVSESTVTGIATIDCIWRRLDTLLGRVKGELPVLAKIPPGIVTAYPRRSKLTDDPEGGLATIEAIFVAAALVGRWDLSLLSEYHFGADFLSLNHKRLQELGALPEGRALSDFEIPAPRSRERNAATRRRDRGRRAIR